MQCDIQVVSWKKRELLVTVWNDSMHCDSGDDMGEGGAKMGGECKYCTEVREGIRKREKG